MPNTLLHKRGTSKPSPSDLLVGEIAINTAEGKLFTENDSGYIWEAGELLGTFSGTTIVYTVTVASKTSSHRYNGQGSSLGYKINGVFSPFLTLTPGNTYRFDQSDSSNSNHPLKFYLEADKSTLYSTNVTINGTAGQSGAYTEITISDTTPLVLHYQCGHHGYMGNAVFCNSKTVNYNDLQNKPSLFSGNYNDLSNKPSLFSGNYNDLSNKPSLFSGDYDDLSNKPSLFSGSYNDLSNKPTIPTLTSQLTNDAGFVTVSGGLTDGDKGDIVVASSGDSLLVDDGVIDNANIASNAAIAGSKINPAFTSGYVSAVFGVNDTDFSNNSAPGVVHGFFTNNSNSGTGGFSAFTATANDVNGTNQGASFIAQSVSGGFCPNVFITQRTASNAQTTALSIDTSQNVSIPNGNLDVTGNITVSGTVDGVDIATRDTLFGTLTDTANTLKSSVRCTTLASNDNSTRLASTAFVQTAIALLVDSAPNTLNTLKELSDALGSDPNFATTVTNSIATKLPLAGGTLTGDLTISSTTPIINLTDTNHDSDYQIKNGNGEFNIKDVTNSSNRLTINANGTTILKSGEHDGGLQVLANGNNQSTNLKIQAKKSDGTEHNWNLGVARSVDRLGIDNGSTTHFCILDNGNIGISELNPSEKLSVNGNISVTGTVDGRDLASDGNKLDGIAAGATNVTNNNQLVNGAGYITSASLAGVNDGGNAASLDGIDSSQFLRSDQNDSSTGTLTASKLFASSAISVGSDAVFQANGFIRTGAIGIHEGGTSGTPSSSNQWLSNQSGNLYWGNSASTSDGKVWTSANEGAGSGLDSDKLDGQQGSYYLNYDNFTNTPTVPTNNNQLTNGAGYITSAALAGASDGGNAALLDGIDSTQFLRSDQNDTTTGILTLASNSQYPLVIDGDHNGKIVLRGSSNPYIRFREGTTDKAYIQWDSSPSNGEFILVNQESNDYLRIGSGGSGLRYQVDGSAAIIWHSVNDGSGSGLDADLLDGVQGSSFLRSDANDTATGQLTLSGGISTDGKDVYTENGAFIASDADGAFSARNGSNIDHIWHSDSSADGMGGTWHFCSDTTYKANGNARVYAGFFSRAGNKVWDQGNDGSGSGLDADKLDNLQASQFIRSDANDTVTGQIDFKYNDSTGDYKTIQVSGNGNHAGIVINPAANKQAHLRFYSSGTPKWQWRVPFHNDGNASIRLYSWVNGDDKFVFNHDGSANFNNQTVWTAGNDGSGSGLDSDKLDGQEGSYYRNASNLNAGTIPAARLPATITGTKTFSNGINVGDLSNGGITGDNYNISGVNQITINDPGEGIVFKSGISLFLIDDANDNICNFSGAAELRVNNSKVWTASNDGSGSGLDSDKLDGQEGSYYRNAGNINAGTLADARIPNLNASKITAGTLNTARLPNTYQKAASIVIKATGGGNDVHLDAADHILLEAGEEEDGNIYFRGNGGTDSYRFAKSGQHTVEGFLSFQSLSDDRTYTFPNASGTVALTSDIPTNNNQLTNGAGYVTTDTNTTYSADGNYGMTLSGTSFRLENDRRRNSNSTDIKTGNTHDYTFYDASHGIRWYTSGSEEMRLENDGDLHVDGNVTAYSTTVSDIRLKKDLHIIQNPLDIIDAINGYTFTYKKDDKKSAGVVAQEVEKVFPQAVLEKGLPYLSDNDEKPDVYKTVEYDQIVGLLVQAVKELTKKVKILESK